MNIDKIRDDIVKLVEEVLDKKTVAGLQADVEEALNEATKSVKEMTDKVAELEASLAESVAIVETLEASKIEVESELASKKEEAEKYRVEKEELIARAEKAEKALDNIEKDRLVETRMSELSELNVARAGDAKEKQELLVREMTEDEFKAYRDDMVALREEIAASLSSGNNGSAVDDGTSADDDSAVNTPPADIDSALDNTQGVLPNAESASNNSGWERFGPALASYIKSQRGDSTGDK